MVMPTWPVRFDGVPTKVEPAPLLGEHTTEVLSDWRHKRRRDGSQLGMVPMTEPSPPPGEILFDAVVPPGRPWGHRVAKGDMLRLIDLEGQQAVDFLCYDAADPTDRYCATNTIKVQRKLFVDKGTVLYSDLGNALFTVVKDTCGRHDTIYGCCSEPNNFLRYGVRGTHSCFDNFVEALAQFGLDRSYIVSNVNFFMSVPIAAGRRSSQCLWAFGGGELCRSARRA
jgi:uncharacterized protein YcgI (DUF1989 family)